MGLGDAFDQGINFHISTTIREGNLHALLQEQAAITWTCVELQNTLVLWCAALLSRLTNTDP